LIYKTRHALAFQVFNVLSNQHQILCGAPRDGSRPALQLFIAYSKHNLWLPVNPDNSVLPYYFYTPQLFGYLNYGFEGQISVATSFNLNKGLIKTRS
jgi:hypothetical protein